jgi:hypothetical protein
VRSGPSLTLSSGRSRWTSFGGTSIRGARTADSLWIDTAERVRLITWFPSHLVGRTTSPTGYSRAGHATATRSERGTGASSSTRKQPTQQSDRRGSVELNGGVPLRHRPRPGSMLSSWNGKRHASWARLTPPSGPFETPGSSTADGGRAATSVRIDSLVVARFGSLLDPKVVRPRTTAMSEPRYISNMQLRADKLPPPDADWEAIQRFALTFNGYTYWGSFERCSEIANARRGETLTELRTCLFFEQRRWRHFGYSPDEESMAYIRRLLEQIRARVAAANALLA